MNPPRDLEPNGFTSGEGPKASDLAQMRVPTLLIVGEEDVVMPPAVIEASHRLIPGSRLEVVAGAGHSVYFERPEIFNRLVLEFFGRVEAGGRAYRRRGFLGGPAPERVTPRRMANPLDKAHSPSTGSG